MRGLRDWRKKRININNDIKDLLIDAKAKGFVPNIIRQVIKARKMDTDKLNEQEALFELYKNAIGLE